MSVRFVKTSKGAQVKKERAVIVTTAHRGVFFGYATKTDGETIEAGQKIDVVEVKGNRLRVKKNDQ